MLSGVDLVHSIPESFMRLHVHKAKGLCIDATGGVAEEVDERSKSLPSFQLSFYFCRHALVGRRFVSRARAFCHRRKQRKLHKAFLPFDYGRAPALVRHGVASGDIRNILIKYKNKN